MTPRRKSVTWPVLEDTAIAMQLAATLMAAAAACRLPRPPGSETVVAARLHEASRLLDDPVAADHEGPVDRGELLDGLVHEGVQDVAVLLLVSKERI